MLSAERNAALTRVGRGTPSGELLRRYWHPIAPVQELREKRVKPVRLLGEDLLLFSAAGGQHGLVARRCSHRGTDLAFGWVDNELLRCPYHGWAFDARGRCVEQPFEQAADQKGFGDRASLLAYPTAVLGGLIWAYLGPEPAPLLPDFEPFSWDRGFVEISITTLPCNWFQCHENGVDPVHFEWLHQNQTAVQSDAGMPRYAAPHMAIEFVEFDYGFICGRELGELVADVRPIIFSNAADKGGMLCMWPYTLMTGPTIEWRVPIDDEHTLNLTRHYTVFPDDVSPSRQDPDEIPYWYGPLTDLNGQILTANALNQDFAAWVGQGVIADRTVENIGRTDSGIARLRRRHFEEMDRIAKGFDPPGTVRDPAANKQIELPIYRKSRYIEGVSREKINSVLEWHRSSPYAQDGYPCVQSGRPEHVKRMYLELAGIDG